MPIAVECDICGKKYRFADTHAGRTVACKECGSSIEIPGGKSRSRPDDEDVVRPMPTSRGGKAKGAKKSRSGSNALLFVAVGGGVAVLAIAAVVGVLLTRGRGQPAANPAEPTAAATSSTTNPASPAVADASKSAEATPPTTPTPAGTNLSVTPTLAAAKPVLVWSVAADPAPSDWALTGTPKTFTPKVSTDTDGVRYPRSVSPFVMFLGGDANAKQFEVGDLRDGKRIGSGEFGNFNDKLFVLSPDGQHLAFPTKKSHQVQVLSATDGKVVKELAVEAEGSEALELEFGPEGTLICFSKSSSGGKTVNRLRAIDIAAGSLKWELVDPDGFAPDKVAYSPGRKYVASSAGQAGSVSMFDLQSGKLIGQAVVPAVDRLGQTASLHALAFSPDGAKLAILTVGGGSSRVYTLDVATGEVLGEPGEISGRLSEVYPESIHYKGPGLEWLPGGDGWVLEGLAVMDAASGRVLWRFEFEYDARFRSLHNWSCRRWVPGGVVVAEGPRGGAKLKFVPIDLDEYRALATQPPSETDAAIVVAPGRAVSLKVEIASLRGEADANATQTALADLLTERLESDGLKVEEGQPAVLRLRYKEVAGKQMPFRGLGQPLNESTSVETTKMQVEAAIISADGKTTYWSHALEYEPTSLVIRGQANVKTVRDATFEHLKDRLPGLPLPYYLSNNKKAPMVPMVYKLPYKS